MLKYFKRWDEARCLGEDSDTNPTGSVTAVRFTGVKTVVVEVRDYLSVHHSSRHTTVGFKAIDLRQLV